MLVATSHYAKDCVSFVCLILNDSALRTFFTKELKLILEAIYSNLSLCTKEMRVLFKPILVLSSENK